jgi:hypothetical protein
MTVRLGAIALAGYGSNTIAKTIPIGNQSSKYSESCVGVLMEAALMLPEYITAPGLRAIRYMGEHARM